MKLGIFTAFLFWFGLTVSWGEESVEDLDLRPPVISKEEVEKKGRIEFHFGLDGSLKGKDLQVLETDEAIKNYILKSKDEFVADGKEPILHLKGVTDPKFGTVRRLVTIANDNGINRVIISLEMGGVLEAEAPEVAEKKAEQNEDTSEVFESKLKNLIESSIRTRENDLGLALPRNEPKQPDKKVFIHLNAQGQVFLGKEKTPLDNDAENREMPLLKAELEKLQAGGDKLSVIIHVEPATVQQRVIDLLNTLAAVKISSVSFIDQIEPEGGKK